VAQGEREETKKVDPRVEEKGKENTEQRKRERERE